MMGVEVEVEVERERMMLVRWGERGVGMTCCVVVRRDYMFGWGWRKLGIEWCYDRCVHIWFSALVYVGKVIGCHSCVRRQQNFLGMSTVS
jgi:hypothetical protein